MIDAAYLVPAFVAGLLLGIVATLYALAREGNRW